MRSYTKTVYVADDGRTFDSDLDCRMHEQQLDLVRHLRDDPDVCLAVAQCEDAIRSLLKKYDITLRKEI
jgi:hypothetical protein